MLPDCLARPPGSGSNSSTHQGAHLVDLAQDDPRLGGGKRESFQTQSFVVVVDSAIDDKQGQLGHVM